MKIRPQLEKAMALLAAKGADAMLVSKLDRLSRSIHDFSGLLETFRKHEWALVILDLDLDTSTPTGEAMAHMAGVFAQFERRMIGQRTREALAVKRAQGIRLGRPRLVTDATAKQVCKLRRAGKSYQQIADVLNAGGSTSPTGNEWAWTSIRQIASRT